MWRIHAASTRACVGVMATPEAAPRQIRVANRESLQ